MPHYMNHNKSNALPYNSSASDTALFEALIHHSAKFTTEEHAIRNISAVGALLGEDDNIRKPDMDMIIDGCVELAKAGVPFHPELSIKVYNLLSPIRSDFLRASYEGYKWDLYDPKPEIPQTDLLITCYLPNFSSLNSCVTRLKPEQLNMQRKGSQLYTDHSIYGLDRLCAVSPRQTNPAIWGEAAARQNAKIAMTFGGTDDAVSSDHFYPSYHFDTLIETSEDFHKASYGYSRGSFAVMMTHDYRETLARKGAKLENLVGHRINFPVKEALHREKIGKLER